MIQQHKPGASFPGIHTSGEQKAQMNSSAQMYIAPIPRRFERVDKGITDAKIQNGLLWIHKPKKRGYFRVGRNYHVSDYNLFYSNIRKNVQERIDSYYRQKQE